MMIGGRWTWCADRAAKGQRECVCPPGDGWFLQVTNFRIALMVQGNSGVGQTGQGGVRDFLGHRPWHDLVFLLAGVDTTSGPPHPLVPADRVPAVLQKGA